MNGFLTGFTAFFEAFGFISRHKLMRWYLVPVILWIILVAGTSFSLAGWLAPIIKEWLNQWLGVELPSDKGTWWQTAREWLHTGLNVVSVWVIHLLLWYFLGRLMKYVILIITSPLLAWLSEKAEKIITGRDYPFSLWQLLKDAWRGILITLRNLFLEILMIAGGFILSLFFPAGGIFITLALFLVNCYFMGFSMYDYYTERRKMNIRRSVAFMRSNRMQVLGLGFAFNLMAWVPFADWVIAPVNGAIGAVLSLKNQPEFAENVAKEAHLQE